MVINKAILCQGRFNMMSMRDSTNQAGDLGPDLSLCELEQFQSTEQ